MGVPEEEWGNCGDTEHCVTLTRGFWLLETPVTQEMWEALTGANPSYFCSTGAGAEKARGLDTSRFPVEDVSWQDCQAFIEKLNADGFAPSGFEFRLPWEAEWEYACWAGVSVPTPYFWEKMNMDKANCGSDETKERMGRTTEVGSYAANDWGFYDMCGNVLEWCADWYDAYDSGAQTDPTGLPWEPLLGGERVMRGGCWDYDPWRCEANSRHRAEPTRRRGSLVGGCYGFRFALSRKS